MSEIRRAGSAYLGSVYCILAGIWVGGMWAVGFLSAPILFDALSDQRTLAGDLAGRQFAAMAWVGMVCASGLSALKIWWLRAAVTCDSAFWIIMTMFVLCAAGHFGVQPLIAEIKIQRAASGGDALIAQSFALWHGIASAMYLLQSLLGLCLLALFGWRRVG